MFELNKLVRENIRDLIPYSSARSEHVRMEGIFLDANENSMGDFSAVVPGMDPGINRYPDPFQTALKKQVSNIKGIPAENIFLGNGSDEAIDLLFRIFCSPGKDNVIICPPTYGMYEVAATINDTRVCKVNLGPGFDLNTETILETVDSQTKLIFLCSPNNPTGNLLSRNRILQLCEQFAGIVVVDEAYVDFAQEGSVRDALPAMPNLVVLQTLSKAWALAGLRIGMAFAVEPVIDLFNKVKPPYNISASSQSMALKALKNGMMKDRWIRELLNERERLTGELSRFSFVSWIYPSDANFILVRFTDHDKIFRTLLANRIVVRDRSSSPGCEGCLRITIGTRE